MSDTGVAPPATATWYDLDVTTTEALGDLRLTEQDVDVERIRTIIPAEAARIDREADRLEAIEGPPPPPLIQRALVRRVVDAYQVKVPTSGGFGLPIDSTRSAVLSEKERFGVS